jgi:mRNA interferase RelE/StbE
MSYKLHFIKKSKKEWDKLNSTIKEQFKKKLAKRLVEPIVPSDKLSGYENVYKIKLKSSGYRLAYEVKEDKIIIVVLAIGKRENNDIYNSLKKRLDYDS